MTHPDEGVIHTWLDGQLSVAEAAELEAHVAGCAECSARVAEARGLVARASWVLGALDDVGAPSAGGAWGDGRSAVARRVRRRNWLRVGGWLAAAVVVLAVGVTVVKPGPAPTHQEVNISAERIPAVATAPVPATGAAVPRASVAAPAPAQRPAAAPVAAAPMVAAKALEGTATAGVAARASQADARMSKDASAGEAPLQLPACFGEAVAAGGSRVAVAQEAPMAARVRNQASPVLLRGVVLDTGGVMRAAGGVTGEWVRAAGDSVTLQVQGVRVQGVVRDGGLEVVGGGLLPRAGCGN